MGSCGHSSGNLPRVIIKRDSLRFVGMSLTGALLLGGCSMSVDASTAASSQTAGRELITVRAASAQATTATFTAYRIVGRRWIRVFGPWTAHVGYHGIAPAGQKREGDGRTPSGTYGFSFLFGIMKSPGVHFTYRRIHSYDYWDDDVASPFYNSWVDARHQNPGRSPEPMNAHPAYDYGAVIAYNTARTPGLGSAIFLHVARNGPTAGCVSLPRAELLRVLRWLDPARSPQIQITS